MNKHNIDRKVKNQRLYIEVRYAKSTSLTLPPTALVFRLKMAGRNLLTEDYANNLAQYLDDTQNVSSLTMNDLNTALGNLQGN